VSYFIISLVFTTEVCTQSQRTRWWWW